MRPKGSAHWISRLGGRGWSWSPAAALPLLGLAALLAFPAGCSRALPPTSPSKVVSRVVCMAPAYTEICFALGKGAAVAGVTDFCLLPKGFSLIPRVGGLLNPNLERIVSLRPDLVYLAPEQTRLKQNLEALGIPTAVRPVYAIADILTVVREMGRDLGAQAMADRLAEAIRAGTAPPLLPPGASPPRVLLVVGRNPGELSGIFVAGAKTFLSEVLHCAGGENAYQGTILYPTLSLEGIVGLNPDVIVEMRPGEPLGPSEKAALAGDWRRLPMLSAVKNDRVVVLTEEWINIPGPRVIETVKLFRRVVQR